MCVYDHFHVKRSRDKVTGVAIIKYTESVDISQFKSALLQVISMVSCQKGPTRHEYAWQIGPFWQDTLDI